MEPFYKKFKEGFRRSKYKHAAALAKDLDVDPSYISTMKNGRGVPSKKMAAKIATKLNLDYEQLLRSIEYQRAPDHLKKDFEKTEDFKVSIAATKQEPAQTKIPLIAYVSAGEPFECEASEFEWIDLPMGVRPDEADRYYAVRVRGTSMLPFLKDGATLIVKKETLGEVMNSDIVIFRDSDHNCWVKQVQFIDNSVVFNSFNPVYPPIMMQKKAIIQMEKVECVIF